MRAVRSRNNRADRLLGRLVWHRGLRYRRYAPIPGKPDLLFVGARVAVFVDGDFWHARILQEQGEDALANSLTEVRRDWWIAKLSATAARDKATTRRLTDGGWTVLR